MSSIHQTSVNLQAYQSSVSIYILCGSLGVLLWDILDNASSDFYLIFKTHISFTTVVYLGSRMGSLEYAIGCNIFQTAPTGDCSGLEKIAGAFYPISLGLSGFLFFIRLRAVFNDFRSAVAFFFLLWLGLLGSTMIAPLTVHGTVIGDTRYCRDTFPKAVYASILSPLIYDTLVFGAITCRLVMNVHVEMGIKDGFMVAFSGKYLPTFSRGMLKDGQKYYLLSLIFNLMTVVIIFNTSVPVTMRSMWVTPNVVLTNIMACRVYRNTRFSCLEEWEVSTSTSRYKQKRTQIPIFAHTQETTMSTYNDGLADILMIR
ncbi:hypothetical protein BDN70DRAFT_886012, partial [Pholiota conissans]